MEECPSCGKRYAKYPLKDEQGKMIWKNWFRIDIVSVIFMIAIALMTYGYITETAQCREVIEHPCGFCAESNCCDYIEDGIFNQEAKAQDIVLDLPSLE